MLDHADDRSDQMLEIGIITNQLSAGKAVLQVPEQDFGIIAQQNAQTPRSLRATRTTPNVQSPTAKWMSAPLRRHDRPRGSFPTSARLAHRTVHWN